MCFTCYHSPPSSTWSSADMTIVIFPLHSAATSLVSGLGLVVLGSAVLFPVRSSWWQWGPKRKQNFRQLFLFCVTKQSVSFMPPVALKSRLDIVFRRPRHVFVIEEGGFVLATYIMRPCKRPEPQYTRRWPQARCSARFVMRITASHPSNPSRQSQKQRAVIWLRDSSQWHTRQLTSQGRAEQKCRFDTGSTFVLHMWKVLKWFRSKGEARSLKEKH